MDVARRARLGRGSSAPPPAWFPVWFLFFPEFVPEYFAWDIEPRCAQLFIGAGYLFRTAFFLNAAVLTGEMAGFHVLQDRRRPSHQPAPGGLPAEGR